MLAANLGLFLATVAWGSMIPMLAWLLKTWDPYFLAAARYSIGAAAVLVILAIAESRHPKPVAIARWRAWLLGAAGMGLFGPLFTLGVEHTNPIVAAILGSTAPIVAALVARATFRVPIDRSLFPAVGLAVGGGLLATYRPGPNGPSFELTGGEPLILLATACWSWYSVAAQNWLAGYSQLRITGSTMLPGTLVQIVIYLGASLVGAAQFPPAAPTSLAEQAGFAWMGLFCVVGSIFLWNFGVQRVGVVVASLFINFTPISAIAITAAMGTPPTLLQVGGGAVVLAGVLLGQLGRIRMARRAAHPAQ